MEEVKFRVWDTINKQMELIDFYWFEEHGIRDMKDLGEQFCQFQYILL